MFRCSLVTRVPHMRGSELVGVKGGSAFIPGLKTGDFPLRPLYLHKLKQELC